MLRWTHRMRHDRTRDAAAPTGTAAHTPNRAKRKPSLESVTVLVHMHVYVYVCVDVCMLHVNALTILSTPRRTHASAVNGSTFVAMSTPLEPPGLGAI